MEEPLKLSKNELFHKAKEDIINREQNTRN